MKTKLLAISLFRVAKISFRLVPCALWLFLWTSAFAENPVPTIVPAVKDVTDQNDLTKWQDKHDVFARRAAQGGIDILLLGDSITNRWPPALWEDYFKPAVAERFGIEGDQVQNLEWRLIHGELDGIRPKVAVMLIGTNNVPRHFSSDQIAATIEETAGLIQKRCPGCKVLILGLLPRADQPWNIFRDRIRVINGILARLDNGGSIRFLDLSSKVLEIDGTISTQTMPDFLHPSPATYETLMKEIGPVVKEMAGKALFTDATH